MRTDQDLIPKGLRAESLSIHPGRVDISVVPVARSAKCPLCGHPSGRVHSRYVRKIADLPWHGTPVVFRARVRRFFCDERPCERGIFCERLPEVAAHARKSSRLDDALLKRGVNTLPTIGDGRQSGTSDSPSILHAAPESAAGGGLSWLRTGDRIRIDLNTGRCDALVPEEEIERRKREETAPPVPDSHTPWQEMYRDSVGQLDGGAVLEAALKYRKAASKTPRHNPTPQPLISYRQMCQLFNTKHKQHQTSLRDPMAVEGGRYPDAFFKLS